MSKTREANSIMSKVMETLESGKYDGEPDFKLMKILDEDQIETYIEIREMFEQVMELDDMKEAMQMAINRFKMKIGSLEVFGKPFRCPKSTLRGAHSSTTKQQDTPEYDRCY